MIKFFFIFLLISFCNHIFGQNKDYKSREKELYRVVYADSSDLFIDGKANELFWQKAEVRSISNFYSPMPEFERQESLFRMAWNEEYLFVIFEMSDQFLSANERKRDGQPYMDDCAELFIIPAPDSLDSHIGFELNIYQASNDFVYFNNYYNGNDFVLKAFDPEFHSATTYDGTLNDHTDSDKGWTLEMAIPLRIFRNSHKSAESSNKVQWAFQVIRRDRNGALSDPITTSTLFPIYNILEGLHQSKRFGLLEFQKSEIKNK